MLSRRRFVGSVSASLLAAPRGVEAQAARPQHRIAFLTLNPRSGAAGTMLDAVREGLQELGYREGGNLMLEHRFADGNRAVLPSLTAELLSLQPAVFVTFGTPATAAARDASQSLAIVFVGVGDPVGSGFTASLARPGGKLTGLSFVGPELAGKNLELLKLAAPAASTVAVLAAGDPDQPLIRAVWTALEQAAQALHVGLQRFQVRGTVQHLDDALAAIMARRPDGLLTLNDPLFLVHRARILSVAARLRVPTMFQAKDYIADGALLAYLPNYADQGRRVAVYVDKILKGVSPGDLPVEQPTKFELLVNLKTAKALGLTIPPSILLRADHVIE
jgi:putative ABC transport system substrate-binding protein